MLVGKVNLKREGCCRNVYTSKLIFRLMSLCIAILVTVLLLNTRNHMQQHSRFGEKKIWSKKQSDMQYPRPMMSEYD